MAKFKQDQIISGVTKTRSNALKVYCAEVIAAGDVIVATGVQGDFMSVVPARATAITGRIAAGWRRTSSSSAAG